MRTTSVSPSAFVVPDEPTASHLASLIMGAYREMPGLNLNLKQVARMFACPESTCGVALNDLVSDGRLRKLATGAYTKG